MSDELIVLKRKTFLRDKMPLWKKHRARFMRKHPTEGEAALWAALRAKRTGYRFYRQAPLLGYIADFWCPALHLVIEVDGDSHDHRAALDAVRDMNLANQGITTIRLENERVLSQDFSISEILVPFLAGLRK